MQELLTEIICAVRSPQVHESPLGPYFQVLAHDVGLMSLSGPMMLQSTLLERNPSDWTYYDDDGWEDEAPDEEWEYRDHNIERNLGRKSARDSPDRDHALRLRISQSRKAYDSIQERNY